MSGSSLDLSTSSEGNGTLVTHSLTPMLQGYTSEIPINIHGSPREDTATLFCAPGQNMSNKAPCHDSLTEEETDHRRVSSSSLSPSQSASTATGMYGSAYSPCLSTSSVGGHDHSTTIQKAEGCAVTERADHGKNHSSPFSPITQSPSHITSSMELEGIRLHSSASGRTRSDPLTTGCRYQCLQTILPHLRGIISPPVACDLLDVYFTEPGSSFFHCTSPYVLTHVFRKKSVLHPTSPRKISPALLSTILWCAAQTADIPSFRNEPGARRRICDPLYALSTTLIAPSDPDRWYRTPGM